MLREFFTRSLARRLMLASLFSAGILLLVAGMFLHWMFRTTLERQFDARLESLLNGLLANVEQTPDGHIHISRQLTDPLFQLPASGWYWQITPLRQERGEQGGGSIASPSLLEKRFETALFDLFSRGPDGAVRITMVGPHGKLLRVLEQRLELFGENRRYSIIVTGDAAQLLEETSRFGNLVVALFVLFGFGLAILIFLQVRFGLRPLRLLHDEIAEVQEGRREYLAGDFPEEIRPIVKEINQLIRVNREVVERARTQVGNLAHALKTPLAVLMNEAANRDDELGRLLGKQTARMRRQIDLYLERARRAALANTLGVTTPVRATIQPIINALSRIYHDRDVRVQLLCDREYLFRGERQDLEEMLGNLLDNAFKYGGKRVRIACREMDEMLEILVEDDGPGLSPEERARALQRGERLDENAPGSGLGLSIVKDLASLYRGSVELGASDLGGLRVRLLLPCICRAE